MDFMDFAIEQAKKSGCDIPVGAVIVKDGEILASACNMREKDNDITSHAEILAIRQVEKFLSNWRLDGCEIYVTLEPCPMCGWAILQSRIKCVYFGTYDDNYGAFSKLKLQDIANHKPNIYGGIKEEDCTRLLEEYFKTLRK